MPIYRENKKMKLVCQSCDWFLKEKGKGHGDCLDIPAEFNDSIKKGCPKCESKSFVIVMYDELPKLLFGLIKAKSGAFYVAEEDASVMFRIVDGKLCMGG